MTEERPDPPDHRLTRRQTLGIAGAAGTAVVLGGGAGKVVSPYSSDTAQRTLNSSDSIYSQAGGTRAQVSLKGSAASGLVGRIVVGVNPKATPAAV
jgi:hypothetical protein